MRIDFLGLQAFLSISERGSFQRAAAHLNLSQTALSHRLRKLEDDVGVKLFTRTTRQVTLSPAGLMFLPRARQVMDDLVSSFDELRQLGRFRQERLAIGCLPTIATTHLPRVLAVFSRHFPELPVQIHDNSAAEIAALVRSGAAEFGVTILASNRADMELKPLLKEPFMLVCPAGHALAAEKQVNWADLAGQPLIRISPQAGNRALIDDALGSRRESLTWRYEVQHVASALSLVRAGLGLTVVPRLALDEASDRDLVARPLRNPVTSRTIGILSMRGALWSPAAQVLAGLIEEDLLGRD